MDEFFNKVFGSENKNIGNILAEKYRQSGQEVEALAGLRDAQSRDTTIGSNLTLGLALQGNDQYDLGKANLLSRGSQADVFNLNQPTTDNSAFTGGFSGSALSQPSYLQNSLLKNTQNTRVADLPKTGSFLGTNYADGGEVMNPMDAEFDMYRKASAAAKVPMLDRETAIRVIAQMRANELAAKQSQTVAGNTNGYADGGMVSKMPYAYANGGAVELDGQVLQGPGTERSDSIPAVIDGDAPAALSKGEMIIPKHVVEYYGTKHFDGLLEKARMAMKKAKGAKPQALNMGM